MLPYKPPHFWDMVTWYSDKGFPVDVVYMDYAKDFNKVPHGRLARKLQVHEKNCKVHKTIVKTKRAKGHTKWE